MTCATFDACSQTTPVKTNEAKAAAVQRPQSHRYLFVVDTSASMRRRAEAVQRAVGDMLLSGMAGQLRTGDTIGLWTFNERLYSGQFPLQRWSPENRQRIGRAAVLFLSKQKYEKRSQLADTTQQIDRLIKNSDAITVILISDGDEKIAGTPFDAQINAAFEKDRSSQQRLQMPFVTVLRAKAGELTDYRVNLAPWPAEFPPLPPEPKVEVAEVKPAPAPPPQPQAVAPLIISGRKSEPVEAPASATTSTEKPERAAATTTEPSPPAPAKPETSTLIVPETKPPAEASGNVAEIPKPGPKPEATQSATTPPSVQTASPADVTHSETPAPPPDPRIKTFPAQPEASTYSPKPASNTPVTVAPSEPQSTPAVPPPSAPPADAQPVANTSPTESVATPTSPFHGKAPLIIGSLLLVAAAVVWIAMSRRGRAAHRASLITRSLDQKEP
jgi:hypothetical protein